MLSFFLEPVESSCLGWPWGWPSAHSFFPGFSIDPAAPAGGMQSGLGVNQLHCTDEESKSDQVSHSDL